MLHATLHKLHTASCYPPTLHATLHKLHTASCHPPTIKSLGSMRVACLFFRKPLMSFKSLHLSSTKASAVSYQVECVRPGVYLRPGVFCQIFLQNPRIWPILLYFALLCCFSNFPILLPNLIYSALLLFLLRSTIHT